MACRCCSGVGAGSSIPGFHNVPDSVNAVVGSLIGTVSDIQTWQDGNVLELDEAAATPGQNLEINFVNVKSIRRIGLSAFYNGSSTHWLEIQLWDFVAEEWKVVWTFSLGRGLNYRYSDLPIPGHNFIDGSGNAQMRLYHPAGGNASHETFIDYAALIT